MGYKRTPEQRERMRLGMQVALQRRKQEMADYGGNAKWDLDNRPYFHPLPENWEKHKHMNVVSAVEFEAGEQYTPQEKLLMRLLESEEGSKILPLLEKPPPQKYKATAHTVNGGVVIKRTDWNPDLAKEEPTKEDLLEIEEDND